MVNVGGVNFPLCLVACQLLPPQRGNFVIAAVAAIERFIVNGQAAIFLQPPQHRVIKYSLISPHTLDLLGDLVAISTFFLARYDRQHHGIQQRRACGKAHVGAPFPVVLAQQCRCVWRRLYRYYFVLYIIYHIILCQSIYFIWFFPTASKMAAKMPQAHSLRHKSDA